MTDQEEFDEAMEKLHKDNVESCEAVEKSVKQILAGYCSWLPVLFVLSYLESCWIIIMNGGCHGFHWVVSIINLLAVLFWYWNIYCLRLAEKMLRERREFLIKSHKKGVTSFTFRLTSSE